MPRSMMKRSAAVLLAGAILVLGGRGVAAAPPLAGKWLLLDVSGGNEVSLILLEIEEKDGKPTAKNVSSPLGKDVVLEDVRVDATSVRFTFPFRGTSIKVNAFAAKGDDKPKTLRGSIQLGTRSLFAELQRTDLKELGGEIERKKSAAGKLLEKAAQEDEPKAQEPLLKEILDKHGDTAAAYGAAELMLQLKIKAGAKDDELKTVADQMLKIGTVYGPTIDKMAGLDVAEALAKAEKVSPLAVEYARKAEKALTQDEEPAHAAAVLKNLESVLRKSGKTDEAKEVLGRIVKIDEQLDAEFAKTAVPFKTEEFKGREGKSRRVAVVELFTGAQCPPCVSADIAFDAAVKAYKPADVVLLQYHLHIPGPDPLTNADSEKRQKYYGDSIRGTPTMFVSGKVTESLGGFKQHGEERFKTLSSLINKKLETDDQGDLKLSLVNKGDKIEATAEVHGLKKTGDKVRLRFVVIEDVVRYQGRNGQRLHHHVVRAFPGGVDGFALKEANGKEAVTVVLGDLKKSLTDYLVEANKNDPFPDDERPLNLKHLKLVALIQDDESKEILQAAQVEVPETK